MTATKYTGFLTSCILGASILSGCATGTGAIFGSTTAQSTQAQPPLTLDLEAGQVLQIALPNARPGKRARDARKVYYDTAIALAEQYGDERLGMLEVTDTVIGGSNPDGVVFYTFPDEASRNRFEGHPDLPELKSMRRSGWSDLMIFSTTMAEDAKLRFDPQKNYTLAVAWANPANPTDYDRYLDGIEPEFDKVGARFVYKFRDIGYENQVGQDTIPPVQLTLVEWDAPDGLQALTGSQAYKDSVPYFQSGVADFQLFRLEVPKSS